MQTRLRPKIYFCFAVALAAFAGVRLKAYLNIQDLSMRATPSQLALQGVAEADLLDKLIVEMGSRSRAVILDPSSVVSLARYLGKKGEVAVSLQNLRRISVAGRFDDLQLLDELAQLVNAKTSYVERLAEKAHYGQVVPVHAILMADGVFGAEIAAALHNIHARLRRGIAQRALSRGA